MARWNQNTNQPNESLIAPYSLCREVFYPEKINPSKSNTSKVLPSWTNTEKLEVQLPPVCSVGHCSIAELYAIPRRKLNEYIGVFTVVSWRCESRIVLDYSRLQRRLEGRIGTSVSKKPTNWANFTYCKKTRSGSILWFVVQTGLHWSRFYGEKIDNIR